MFTRLSTIVAVVACNISLGSVADASPTMCTPDSCKAGTQAITYATKQEPYFACPSRELADYTNFVVGLVAIQASLGAFSNISPETGEPEVTGETKQMLDGLRVRAQASTFDDAVASCSKGKAKRKVLIINVPADALMAVWVHDDKANSSYWMPISSLNKR